jgi:high-affinity iron transporter
MLGRLLKTLVGYTDRPDGLQLIVWLSVIAAMIVLMRVVNPGPMVAKSAAVAHAAE